MKIALVSDVHTEFGARLPNPLGAGEVDAYVLAGDICTGYDKAVALAQRLEDETQVPVIRVAGNHEYYHENYRWEVPKFLRIGDVSFVYATLWSDVSGLRKRGVGGFNDFRVIGNWSMEQMTAEHYKHRMGMGSYIASEIADGQRVVCVSHFLPSPECVSEEWKGNSSNDYFGSSAFEQMWVEAWRGKLVAWLYGHTHTKMDFVHVDTDVRFVCNPHGYLGYETPDMLAQWKVIEV